MFESKLQAIRYLSTISTNMKRAYRKWIWLSASIAVFLVGAAAWTPLYSAFIDWYLCAQCRDWLGGELERDAFGKEDGKWVLRLPSVMNAISVGGASFDIQAEVVEIDYRFHPLSWKLDLEVLIDTPSVIIREGEIDWNALIIERHGIAPLVKISPKILIRNGKVDFVSDNFPVNTLYFDISVDRAEARKAEVKAGFTPDKEDLLVTLSREGRRTKIHTVLNDFDLGSAYQGMLALFPEYKKWTVPNGSISGEWSAIFSRGAPPVYSCNLTSRELSLNNSGFGFASSFEEVTLRLDEESKGWFLALSKPAWASVKGEEEADWEIHDLLGQCAFAPGEEIRVDIKGISRRAGNEASLTIEGGGLFTDQCRDAASVSLLLEEGERTFSAQFFANQFESCFDSYRAKIHNFGPEEYALVRHFARKGSPIWDNIFMDRGHVDAELVLFLEKGSLTHVRLEQVRASDFCCRALPWNMTLDVDGLTGSASLNFEEENLLETINGELALQSGVLDVDGWKLDQMEAKLEISDGLLKPSTLKGSFAGMDGTIELDSSSAMLDFSGPIAGIAAFGPESFSEGIKQSFSHDKASLKAAVVCKCQHMDVKGSLTIDRDVIDFGLGLHKEKHERWAVCSKKRSQGEMNAIHMPLIGRELNIAGLSIEDGWFEARGVPLEKYVAPFFLRETTLALTGRGDFKGAFNQKAATVHYGFSGFSLESPKFEITVPKLELADKSGVYNINLETGYAEGVLPVESGAYFEKNSGLLFTDITTQIHFNDSEIKLPAVQAFCAGLYFAGDIVFDMSAKDAGRFDLDIHTHTVSGRFSQLQNLFTHFDKPLFFLKMPFEGNLSYRQKGGTIGFTFYPDRYDFRAVLEGAIADGRLNLESRNLVVEDVSLDFAYDYCGNTLDFTDLQGTLLLGKPERVEEYSIAADHVMFTDYSNHKAKFDIWVGDKKRDVVRLVGVTTPLESEDGDSVAFHFDRKLSHFGAVHPTSLDLVMRNWTEVERFDLQLGFKLQTLFHDLQRFGRTGLIPLSSYLVHRLDNWKRGEGEIDFTLHYDKGQELMTYELTGADLAVEEYRFQDVLLKGGMSSGHWMVDQFKLDDWSFAADLTPKDDLLKVNFLGAQLGDSLLLGLAGSYDFEEGLFDGNINLMEVNLEKLEEWEALQPFIQDYEPSGQLKASGKFSVQASDQKSGILVDALLDTSIRSLQLKGFELEDMTGVSCHFTSDRGITFRRLKTAWKSNGMVQGLVGLERADYNFFTHDFLIEGFGFNIPADFLMPLMRQLRNSFPSLLNEATADAIGGIKRSGNLEGLLDLEITRPHYALKVSLNDGAYQFMGQEHDLSHLTIEYDPCEFRLTSQYLFRGGLYWIQSTSRSPTLENGSLVVSTEHPGKDPETVAPLTLHWCRDAANGYYVERMFGPLAGCDFDLVRDPGRSLIGDAVYLEGEVALNGEEIGPLLSPEALEPLKNLGFGKGYALKGKWEVHHPKDDEPAEFYFHGDLVGKDFVCKGYRIDTLTSKIDMSPKYVTLRNLEVTDPAGVLYADQMEVYVDESGKWVMSLPQAQVNDFWPSLLKEVGSTYAPIRKPLVVNRIEIKDIKGDLRDAHTIVGNGKLFFSNPPKKNLQNTIFAVPAEILSRIGLDLKVLNPVTGTIYFDVHDKKIFLTRFKDIFSEGKLSRFYLPNTDYKSYVDFEGNLHVQVKMKQYNLVFKLAELFTVTIQGSLVKPNYSLQKQQSRD